MAREFIEYPADRYRLRDDGTVEVREFNEAPPAGEGWVDTPAKLAHGHVDKSSVAEDAAPAKVEAVVAKKAKRVEVIQ